MLVQPGNCFVSIVRAMRSCVRGRARVGVEKPLFLLWLGFLGGKSPALVLVLVLVVVVVVVLACPAVWWVGLWSRRMFFRGSGAFSRAPGVFWRVSGAFWCVLAWFWCASRAGLGGFVASIQKVSFCCGACFVLNLAKPC